MPPWHFEFASPVGPQRPPYITGLAGRRREDYAVPVLTDCDAPRKPGRYARALLGQIKVELARHGIKPSPLAVLASATDRGVSDDTAEELAVLLKLQGKEPDHASRRKTAGGILRTF